MPFGKLSVAGLLALLAASPPLLAGASSGETLARTGAQLGSLSGATPGMRHPDGTMTSGLRPFDPNEKWQRRDGREADAMRHITTVGWNALGALALATALGACSGAEPTSGEARGAALSPMYDVPPNLMRPDGTMINGLEPIDPSAVS